MSRARKPVRPVYLSVVPTAARPEGANSDADAAGRNNSNYSDEQLAYMAALIRELQVMAAECGQTRRLATLLELAHLEASTARSSGRG